MKKIFFSFLFIFLTFSYGNEIVLITSKDVKDLTKKEVSAIFKGKISILDNKKIIAINRSNKDLKEKFIKEKLNMSLKKYNKYWLVKQYIGKGHKPKEIDSISELIEFTAKQNGVVSYINKNEISNKEIKNIKLYNE